MLDQLLWLSPAAKDLLRTASQLLRGAVPCAGPRLAEALRAAKDSECYGVLADGALRADLAALLEKSAGEVTASTAVELLGKALQSRATATKAAAKALASKFKGMPGFAEVASLLPKGQESTDLLRKDWMLWHALGHSHSSVQVPALAEAVTKDRLASACCAGAGAVAEMVLTLHLLDNLDAYVLWEMSMAGSKPPSAGNEVKLPFDAAVAEQVAVRRVLSTGVFPPEAASAVASEAASGGKGPLEKRVQAALKKLEADARSGAVFPLYAAPAEAKEAKAPKEKKAKQEEAAEEKPAAVGGSSAKATGSGVKAGGGAFQTLKKATATQELQWQLLAYKLRPSTTLGAAAAAPAKGAAKAAPQLAGKAAPAASGANQPQGFAGTWAPLRAELPPGHTEYSWNHAKAAGMKEGFATTWSPTGKDLPPGHTDYSWEKACSNPAPSSAPKKQKKEGGAAASAKKGPAPPPAGGGGTRDEDDDAAAKISLIVGRVTKVWEHPDSDKLFCEEIDCGEGQVRQIGSGLRAFYKKEEFEGRLVLVVANLKPKKLAGFPSNGMVLCASSADHSDVKFVDVPEGAKLGDRVVFGDMPMDPPAEPGPCDKKKLFSKCQPHFNSKGGVAMYKDKPFVLAAGKCTAPVADGYSLS